MDQLQDGRKKTISLQNLFSMDELREALQTNVLDQ